MHLARSEQQPPGPFPKLGQSNELPRRNGCGPLGKDRRTFQTECSPGSAGNGRLAGKTFNAEDRGAESRCSLSEWAWTEPLGANGRPTLFGASHAEAQEAAGLSPMQSVTSSGEQTAHRGHALVEQLGMDALLPGAPLVHQRHVQAP